MSIKEDEANEVQRHLNEFESKFFDMDLKRPFKFPGTELEKFKWVSYYNYYLQMSFFLGKFTFEVDSAYP